MPAAAKIASSSLAVGSKAPDFKNIPLEDGKKVSLKDYADKNLVLYFYPKDDTPGCTVEAKDFTTHKADFAKANTVILGVSKDSPASHQKFITKQCLEISLLADEEGAVCEAYGVWIEKSMYGKKYMGIDRSTFLIDGQGVLRGVWNKVSVKGHVEEVLAAAKAL
jgi:peroxiredoxin Q/BCP